MSEDFVGVLGDNGEESTELFEHFRIVADKGQTLVRVDKFLQNRLENVSRNRVQNAAKAGSILVNDKPVKSNYKVMPLDVITLMMPYRRRGRGDYRQARRKSLRHSNIRRTYKYTRGVHYPSCNPDSPPRGGDVWVVLESVGDEGKPKLFALGGGVLRQRARHHRHGQGREEQ